MHADAPEAARASLDNSLAFALKHREIVVRFDRFPHRNAILCRQSTPEELAWLEASGEHSGNRPGAEAAVSARRRALGE